jgi:hypothetical protein
MRTWTACIGAVIGAVVGVGGGLALIGRMGTNPWIGLASIVILTLGIYLVANTATGDALASVTRGLLIGLNAGLNGLLTGAIGTRLFGSAGTAIGIALGLVVFIAVFPVISNSEVYQGFLGWLNWVLPMSWLVVALGLTFFVLNLLGALIFGLIFRVQFFRIVGMPVDWKTGTFFTHGGWISNLNPIDTAFNMGNFSFIDAASADTHVEHEAGHTLNLGAFGSIFHFIGALDENVTGGGADAFSERLAESNDPLTTQGNIIPMWI